MLRILLRYRTSFSLAHWAQRPKYHVARYASATSAHFAALIGDANPAPTSGPRLRDYQEDCVQSILTAIREGRLQIGVSLATGSGKTVIFTELIGRVPSPTVNATQTLVLVHRRELVEQAARHCSSRYPDKTIDIEMGSMHASGRADITIASVQSINSRNRLQKFDPRNFKLVLVDEAHHIVAASYLRVLEHFGFHSDNNSASSVLVGVSATLSRFDGLALGKAIKHIVYHKDYIDMIGEKWLSDVIFTTVKSNVDISKVKTAPNGDFQTGLLSKAVNTTETNDITVRAWKDRACDRKSTLVFCVDVGHVKSLSESFRMNGVDARYITGGTPKQLRGERLDNFRNQEFPVLLNCGVFTEGTDIPNIDCVLLARPTKSRNLLVQMIGRGMRLYHGKSNCHVIDMVASLESGIVTTPTLFGLNPDEIVTNATIKDMEKTKNGKAQQFQHESRTADVSRSTSMMQRDIHGKITFTHYASVSDLVDDTSSERYIRAISANSWVHVGEDRYILTNGSLGSYLTIEKTSPPTLFSVKITNRLAKTATGSPPFAKPKLIANSETFESAVHGADTYASKRFTHMFISKNPPGNWRNKPASDAQIAFLNKYRAKHELLTPEDITKGKAGDMITKLRFGAKGRFEKTISVTKQAVRAEKKREKWKQQQKQEIVQVGPLDV